MMAALIAYSLGLLGLSFGTAVGQGMGSLRVVFLLIPPSYYLFVHAVIAPSKCSVRAGDMIEFLKLQATFFDSFVKYQEGYRGQQSMFPYLDTAYNATTVFQMFEWESYELYSQARKNDLSVILDRIASVLGYAPQCEEVHDGNGLRMLTDTSASPRRTGGTESKSTPIEVLIQQSEEGDFKRFLEMDALYWTSYLSKQEGFLNKETLIPYFDTIDNATICYQAITWRTLDEWKSISEEVHE